MHSPNPFGRKRQAASAFTATLTPVTLTVQMQWSANDPSGSLADVRLSRWRLRARLAALGGKRTLGVSAAALRERARLLCSSSVFVSQPSRDRDCLPGEADEQNAEGKVHPNDVSAFCGHPAQGKLHKHRRRQRQQQHAQS
jgi:hypothetical protein